MRSLLCSILTSVPPCGPFKCLMVSICQPRPWRKAPATKYSIRLPLGQSGGLPGEAGPLPCVRAKKRGADALPDSPVCARGAWGRCDPFCCRRRVVSEPPHARQPVVLPAHPSLGSGTIAELTALAKQQGSLRYATGSGVGSPQHMVVQWYAQIAGMKMEQVPYRGGGRG